VAKTECRYPKIFEEFIHEGFVKKHRGSEAMHSIEDLVKGGDTLSEAVALTIDSLPEDETEDLRQAVENYEQWCQMSEVRDLLVEKGFNAKDVSLLHFRFGQAFGFRVHHEGAAVDLYVDTDYDSGDIEFVVQAWSEDDDWFGDDVVKILRGAGYLVRRRKASHEGLQDD